METTTVKIRGVTNSEAEMAAIYAILTEDNKIRKRDQSKLHLEKETRSEAEFRLRLKLGNVVHKVAVIKSKPVAYLEVLLGKHIAVIDRFVVLRKHRRQGVGKQLLGHLKSILPGLRREIIGVDVHEANLAAQLCLKDSGFTWFRTLDAQPAGMSRYVFRYPPASDKD